MALINNHISEELKIIFENAAAVLALVNAKREVVHINKAGRELTGESSVDVFGELAGNVFNCINSWSETKTTCGQGKNCSECQLNSIIGDTLNNNKKYDKEEVPFDIYRGDQVVHLHLLVSSARVILHGEKYILLTIDDITSQKGQEKKLQQIVEDKNRLISIISHDLRGPLGSFQNMTELLKSQWGRFDQNRVQKILDELNSSAKNTYQLLEDLLSWAKNQAGNIDFNPESFDLRAVIDETIESISAAAKDKGISISLDLSENPIVFADKKMIKTILRNLYSNAIKYSNSASIIAIYAEIKNNDIIVKIKDQGIGIQEDTLNQLFSENPVSSMRGTQGEKGSGFGLLLCHDLIVKNNGKIWADSTPGIGSTFSISIPLSKDNK